MRQKNWWLIFLLLAGSCNGNEPLNSEDSSSSDSPGDPQCNVSAPQLNSLRLVQDGHRLRDILGRQVMLRGV
ncbi:MAG TPA: hypothetical protein EYN06_04075, partial [Myxococcales bacterium]|nr:hypothetical protein [Myxococcales bacterium]